MPSLEDRSGSSAYRPTSLDFINLPNPIQPAPPSQKHPLNGTPHLEKARLDTVSNQDLFRLVLDPSGGGAPKRPRPVDSPNLDLPKLPVRNNAKRLRIPPTLSGLHQPPPDARLLPSISVDKPRSLPSKTVELELHTELSEIGRPADRTSTSNAPAPANEWKKQPKKLAKRNKWTTEETEDLLKGVARFGVGNWTKIWNCSDYQFNSRTALDLKDRFRVCFPDHNKNSRKTKLPTGEANSTDTDDQEAAAKRCAKGPAPERVDTATLEKLGITEPFVKSERRSRHGYSAAEDAALLRGFMKHGKAWTAIKQDPDLNLSSRQATDLRDRMRTRFPDEYAKAGLAPRVKKQSGGSKDSKLGPDDEAQGERRAAVDDKSGAQQSATVLPKMIDARKPQQQALFSLDDVYLGRLGEDEDDDDGPITLDRGILDWATDTARPVPVELLRAPDHNTSLLPKPIQARHNLELPMSQATQSNNATSLPSLASLLPENNSSEHLELPSLTEWWGQNDGRGGGASYPSLEEILSHDL
ncbi:hypothetical protein CERZMDRAFT_100253 [Cercospora zeae-maydis SCOH1-5]|uniref:Myb-like domain-containing protein n=1 Tax=Cercospora zeae-maydis SCOH1-5 TaxID=717836 RepID=A0A6A6F7Y0_9PEZI|nr:hypothetical protein CERZMDRAFT_100253 [Cercospora zeae-maydis SCOH1-5]